MSGVDLSTIAELMGHKSTMMTTRYAHLSAHHKEQAMEKLSAFNAAAILISAGKKPTDTTTDTSEKRALVMGSGNVQ
jgi:hypothetical protein